MTTPHPAMPHAQYLGVIVGGAIGSLAAIACGAGALTLAPMIPSESAVENMPAGMLAFLGVMLVLAGLAGGLTCVVCARLVPRVGRARSIAYLAGSVALAAPVLLIAWWVILSRIA